LSALSDGRSIVRLRDAAIRYAEQEWAVFPCKQGQKVPATRHGCKDATTDLDQVRAWWDADEHNIGVATGKPSGIWVLDVDGTEGLDALLELGHGVPGTLTAYTPSGGMHLIFADPGGVGNTASSIARNVDSRGDGGYIVVAPSIHPNGGRYRWGAKQTPEPIPGWLIRDVRKPPAERKAVKVTDDATGYVGAALRAEVEAVVSAIEGTRNDTLNRAGWNLGTLVGANLMSREVAVQALTEAGQECGLPAREIAKTLDQALAAGEAHPRELAS